MSENGLKVGVSYELSILRGTWPSALMWLPVVITIFLASFSR